VVANGGSDGAREWFRAVRSLTPGVHQTVFGPWPNGVSIAAESWGVEVVALGPPGPSRPAGPRRHRRGPYTLDPGRPRSPNR
jgi:hypothetical protein